MAHRSREFLMPGTDAQAGEYQKNEAWMLMTLSNSTRLFTGATETCERITRGVCVKGIDALADGLSFGFRKFTFGKWGKAPTKHLTN